MADFKKGQEVWVLCEAQPGAFPDERLVTINSTTGPISGFVKTAYLEQPNSRTSHVRAQILSVLPDAVELRIPGLFFTTASGIASVPRNLLAA
ncbi:MAG TPA: hypothetical protein VGY99_06785 [Candidatus Binataceae bacterium]|jgi:hypothetical protein|nr:hypothetical protein [Candidatus Binataceae bacterium]